MTNPPRLRMGLDFFPLDHEGREMIALRDPLKVAAEAILVPPPVFFLLAHMDGKNTLVDLQVLFTRQYGDLIFLPQIEELIEDLDRRGFMETPAFRDRMEAEVEAFRRAPVRLPALAGESYPSAADELSSFLERLFEGLDRESAPPAMPGSLAGIVAPHIDLNRGGPVFARAYRALREAPPPSTVLILGTAHQGPEVPFILTAKDFETPLGRARHDADFISLLEKGCSFDLKRGEIVHRTEHSVEFQVLLLQHALQEKTMPLIVPVLCGSMDNLEPSGSPEVPAPVEEFIAAAQEAIGQAPGPVLVIAGADLCHVGRKFGGRTVLSKGYLEKVEKEDRQALEAAEAVDGGEFFRRVARIKNRNNICSVTGIYTLLRLVEGAKGRLLHYDMAVDRETDSAVGFATLEFRRT